MSFSLNLILFCCILTSVILCIYAAPITHQNESNVSTAAVVHHTSYTKVYVGAGCGCGGLLGLIILYWMCRK